MTNHMPITIEPGTPAFEALKNAIAKAEERELPLHLVYNRGLQLKLQGGVWTTPHRAHKPREINVCSDPDCPCS